MTNNNEEMGVVSLAYVDLEQLYRSFMPFFKNGGLFFPTLDPYQMGQEVIMEITLPDSTDKVKAKGIVSWVTPLNSAGHNREGVGVEFSDGSGITLRHRISSLLADKVDQKAPSHTL